MKPLNKTWNIAPRNPTQTRYRRFLKMPGSELKTSFTDIQKDFEKHLNDRLKTHYSDYWETDYD